MVMREITGSQSQKDFRLKGWCQPTLNYQNSVTTPFVVNKRTVFNTRMCERLIR